MLFYPALKLSNLVPSDALVGQAEAVSAERAQSLSFRFDNEDILFDRAMEKPLFGWGIWGRNHLHDATTGAITTVSDGYWIIVIGVWGWLGYIAQFGLMALPIWLISRELRHERGVQKDRLLNETSYKLLDTPASRRELDDGLSPYIGPLAVMLGFNMIDMLPNATLTPTTWLIAGTLFGHAERLARRRLSGEDLRDAESAVATKASSPERPRTIL